MFKKFAETINGFLGNTSPQSTVSHTIDQRLEHAMANPGQIRDQVMAGYEQKQLERAAGHWETSNNRDVAVEDRVVARTGFNAVMDQSERLGLNESANVMKAAKFNQVFKAKM